MVIERSVKLEDDRPGTAMTHTSIQLNHMRKVDNRTTLVAISWMLMTSDYSSIHHNNINKLY